LRATRNAIPATISEQITRRRIISHIGKLNVVVVPESVVPETVVPVVFEQHPGSHAICVPFSWYAQIVFGMDSVPRAGVNAVVSCATNAQFFVAYCGPQ
jgi:hypothetical protein